MGLIPCTPLEYTSDTFFDSPVEVNGSVMSTMYVHNIQEEGNISYQTVRAL